MLLGVADILRVFVTLPASSVTRSVTYSRRAGIGERDAAREATGASTKAECLDDEADVDPFVADNEDVVASVVGLDDVADAVDVNCGGTADSGRINGLV